MMDVVANSHVVDNGREFTVIMHEGTQLDAELVGKDARTDLAVLKVAADRKFTYVGFDQKTTHGSATGSSPSATSSGLATLLPQA